MRKSLIVLLIISVLASGSLVGTGCSSEAELEGVDVELEEVLVLYGGSASVTTTRVFSFYNPNDYEVTLDKFSYSIMADGLEIGQVQVRNDVYLPADTTVNVSDSGVVTFGGMVGDLMIPSGKDQMTAIMEALPVWKAMGGAVPYDFLQTAWDALEDTDPEFTAEVSAYAVKDNNEVRTDFTDLTWTAE